jgi:ribokinase
MAKSKARVAVVGSSNMDLVVKSDRIPVVGETILGGDFLMAPGGKGANQAVAAAKLGGQVFFIAKLGDDIFGTQSLANFKKVGVNTKYVSRTKDAPSGVALIMVDATGNNLIVVAPGANQKLSAADVKRAKADIASCGAVVAQLEISLETVVCAAQIAKKAKSPFILNPAPARPLPVELLKLVDVLTPNETEARILSGIAVNDETTARAAAEKLLETGVGTVILTMGIQGYLLAGRGATEFVAAHKVKAVDTTAAGDAFTGGFAFALAAGRPIAEAARFANYVAALSVTKMGAQPSMPTLQEVEKFRKSAG